MPDLAQALDRGLELAGRAASYVLPTYTAMLELQRIVAGRGLVPPVLGAGGVKLRVGHLYPDYLYIYADRGNIAVLIAPGGLARARARGRPLGSARRSRPASTTSTTSAAARTASRC